MSSQNQKPTAAPTIIPGTPGDYDRLRELLSNESFPHAYVHKFIGKNTDAFAMSVAELERQHPQLSQRTERESSSGGHLALTYVFLADGPEAVINLLQSTSVLADLLMIL